VFKIGEGEKAGSRLMIKSKIIKQLDIHYLRFGFTDKYSGYFKFLMNGSATAPGK